MDKLHPFWLQMEAAQPLKQVGGPAGGVYGVKATFILEQMMGRPQDIFQGGVDFVPGESFFLLGIDSPRSHPSIGRIAEDAVKNPSLSPARSLKSLSQISILEEKRLRETFWRANSAREG